MLNLRTVAIAIITFALTGWRPSPPPGIGALYSQSFQLVGQCTGGDMVYSWSVDNKPGGGGIVPPHDKRGTSFIYPWLPFDITIHGAELTVLNPVSFSWIMIGNNANGDTMLFLAGDQRHAVTWYPSDLGFQFPGQESATPMTYIDLHGACAAGQRMAIMMTLYYAPNP